jgi:hypothetical protein
MSMKGSANSFIELRGNVSNSGKVKGSLSSPKEIQGESAYEIAVLNGFVGSEAEWLASLVGPKPEKGKDYFTPEDIQAIVNEITGQLATARIGEVSIFADKWVGNASPYSQVVEVEGVTENSQVDLTPSVEQLAIFHEKDLAFVTENYGGVVTVYAVGQKPENDYTIQVTITEVTA